MRSTLKHCVLAVLLLGFIFLAAGEALAAASQVVHNIPSQITASATNFPAMFQASRTDNTTEEIKITINIAPGGGSASITIPAYQSSGNGAINLAINTPGNYQITISATGGTASLAGNANFTVVPTPTPYVPTRPPVITQVESTAITAGTTVNIITKKTEVKVSGTCQAAGETIEVMVDGNVVGYVVSPGASWQFPAVTIPVQTSASDTSFHTVSVKNAAGTSNIVNVRADVFAPQFSITYDPTTQPYGITTFRYTITFTEALDLASAALHVNIITPEGNLIPVTTFTPTTGTASSVSGSIPITKTGGAVSVNGMPTVDGSFRFAVDATDQAGNFGTRITGGENFSVNTGGPSAAGASVTIESGAAMTNKSTVNFTWQGFTPATGVGAITKYWFIGTKPPATPATGNNTSGWQDGGAGNTPANGGGSGTWNIPAGNDGTYEISVKAQNATEFSSIVKSSIIVDTVGPAGGTPSPANGGTTDSDQVEISCILTDPTSGLDPNSVTITVNGTQYSYGNAAVSVSQTATAGQYKVAFTPYLVPGPNGGYHLPKGNNTVSVNGKDKVGNNVGGTSVAGSGTPYQWSFNVNINSEAPVIAADYPVAAAYVNSKHPPIRFKLTDPDLIDSASATMSIANGSSYMTFNVGPNMTLTNPTAPATESLLTLTPPMDFTDGTVTVVVQAKDRVGNAATPFTHVFHIDTTPPVPSSPVPQANTSTTSTTPVISLKLDDAGAGVDTATDSVRLLVTFVSLTNPSASFAARAFTIDDPNQPGLTYNASTRTLSFNPSQAVNPAIKLGVGSVEISLATARDRAVTGANPATAAPNTLTTAFNWSFSITTAAGPVVSYADCRPLPPDQITHEKRMSNMEPLRIRVVLADETLIDHKTLLVDFNGRTYRDGDAQITWELTTCSIMTGTHEAFILAPETSLIKQGDNTVTLRSASNRNGLALQTPNADLSFTYDTIGPTVNSTNPATGGTIYDMTNGIVKCNLTDDVSGVSVATLRVTQTSASGAVTDLGVFGTDSTPVNLVYDPASKDLTFRNSTAYVPGATYSFSLIAIPPVTDANPNPIPTQTGTRDKAGNGIGKVAGSQVTKDYTWSLKAATTSDVIILTNPTNDAFVNVTKSDFKFSWNALPNAAAGQTYRLSIADNLSFANPVNKDTTNLYYMDSSLAVDLAHGNIYYWQVSALTNGSTYGTSERRQFTVDNLPPQTPRIVGVLDYRNLNPVHLNDNPLNTTTYVRTRNIRVRVLMSEGPAATVGYRVSVGYVKNIDGYSTKYTELGVNWDVHGNDTNEVDITLPDDDGEYRLVAYTLDRASNQSTQSEQARVYLNRKVPKVNNIILTSPAPNTNGYITSGKVKFDVIFNTPISMMALKDYVVAPSIKFDPRSGEGTAPIELTDYVVNGNTITGYGYIPYGNDDSFNGMADVIITGFNDAAWNSMEGGTITYYKYFEIDTAPGFTVKTFLNPVDEKNVLINIQSSELLTFAPSCFITISTGAVNQIPVNIMAKNLYAASYTGTVGENNIRITGLDTRNNVGYWPAADQLKESKFLMAQYKSAQDTEMESKDMGVKVTLPKNAIASDTSVYVLPYNLDYIGNNLLSSVKSPAKSPSSSASKSARKMSVKGIDGKVLSYLKNGGSVSDVKFETASKKAAAPSKTAKAQAAPAQPDVELTQASMLYNVAPVRSLRKDGLVEIDFPADRYAALGGKKAGVYYSADGILWDFVSGSYADGRFTAPMRSTGIYGVFVDSKAPAFTASSVDRRQVATSYRPELFAFVADDGSGIDPDSAKVLIDGVEYKAEYTASEGRITFRPSENIAIGQHSVTFEITDHAGNVNRQAGNLLVPQVDPDIVSAIAYPNPARGANATISFTLNGILNGTVVDAKVYLYDINANRVAELIPVQTGFSFKANWLGLVNDDGDRVANGIYFYKIKVNCADKTVEKFGKIAVLR